MDFNLCNGCAPQRTLVWLPCFAASVIAWVGFGLFVCSVHGLQVGVPLGWLA